MDPQLAAIRKAQRERFEQHKKTAEQMTQQDAEQSTPASSSTAKPPSSILAGVPPERLNAPISSLLADAPEPVAKRPKTDGSVLRVPPGRTAEIKRLMSEPLPLELRILSWNIDGLDEVGGPRALMLRTLEVAVAIARHRPAVVLLQEAVPPALELILAPQLLGGAYDFCVPKNPPQPYYVAILYDKKVAKLTDKQEVAFPSTEMGRQLLSACFEFPGRESPALVICTAHLESTKDCGPERKRQLATCFRHLRRVLDSRKCAAAILAGDLNIRDAEVDAVKRELGVQGAQMSVEWVFCGSPEKERWTWDTTANDNLAAPYKSKCRFDRMFFLSPGISDKPFPVVRGKASMQSLFKPADVQSKDAAPGWRPLTFSLVGKERVPDLRRFPSDHWGLLTSWGFHAVRASPDTTSVTSVDASAVHRPCNTGGSVPQKSQTPADPAISQNAAPQLPSACEDDEDEDLKAAIALSLAATAQSTESAFSTSLAASEKVIDLDD